MEERQPSGTGDALLAAALSALEEQGPDALQARKLTAEIGASTMAVYTHFGGMPGLVDAMVREGLVRFAAHVRSRPAIEDPLTDLISGGLQYSEFALANPQLYSLMFGLSGKRHGPVATVDAAAIWRMDEGIDAFSILFASVERVIDAGQIRAQEPRVAAAQILSVTHGYLMLAIGGFIAEELQEMMPPLAVNLMVGLGADREEAERALTEAVEVRAGGA